MAKTVTKTAPAKPGVKTNVPAVRQSTSVATASSQLPDFLVDKMDEHAGMGASTNAEDNLIPIITVIQKQSPQAEKRDPKYIEGAEAGCIWLRGAANPIVNGEEGFLFQHCCFEKDWVEWIPRSKGGGYVGRHKNRPVDAKQVAEADERGEVRNRWIRDNGNEVIETRYHIGRVFNEDGTRSPYIIPFQSSGHTVSKTWMLEMNNKMTEKGSPAPTWAKVYRIRTKYRQNAAGAWFVLSHEDAGWVTTLEDYEAGLALHLAFSKGEAQMNENQFASDVGGSASTASTDNSVL